MPRITEEMVQEANSLIGNAAHGVAAMDIAQRLSPTLLARVGDLQHVKVSGRGKYDAYTVVEAHGWNPYDDVPPDGHGPCQALGEFQPHSRRPAECRGCGRRRIDHRPVV